MEVAAAGACRWILGLRADGRGHSGRMNGGGMAGRESGWCTVVIIAYSTQYSPSSTYGPRARLPDHLRVCPTQDYPHSSYM